MNMFLLFVFNLFQFYFMKQSIIVSDLYLAVHEYKCIIIIIIILFFWKEIWQCSQISYKIEHDLLLEFADL